MRLHALRGAITVDRNTPEAILGATEWLMREIVKRNDLVVEDFVSCFFTATHDLDAEFPAVAARQMGFHDVPLICSQEIPVPGSMERVIRVLAHYYSGPNHRPEPVYLGSARKLRVDLHGMQ